MTPALRARLPLFAFALLPLAPLFATTVDPGMGTTPLSAGTLPDSTLLLTIQRPWDYADTITIPGPGHSINHYDFEGFLRENVWREDASGTLDFQYQFVVTKRTNDGPQAITFYPGFIRNLTLSGYSDTVSTDIFTTDSDGTAFTPTTADRSTLPNVLLDNFTGTNLPISASSDDLLSGSVAIRTNATTFDANGTGIITFAVGESNPTLNDFLLEPAVPEPMSLALLPLALLALTLRLRI